MVLQLFTHNFQYVKVLHDISHTSKYLKFIYNILRLLKISQGTLGYLLYSTYFRILQDTSGNQISLRCTISQSTSEFFKIMTNISHTSEYLSTLHDVSRYFSIFQGTK